MGVRQGDSLSPFLYILVAQTLSNLFNTVVQDKKLTPFSIKRNIKISHLMFADDILISIRANPKSLQTLKKIFHQYELLIGQKLNPLKPEVFFPKSTSRSIISSVCNFLHMKQARDSFGRCMFLQGAPIKPTSALQYEATALKQAVTWANENSITSAIFETDCKLLGDGRARAYSVSRDPRDWNMEVDGQLDLDDVASG
ncbi:hypothetical protein Cni_G01382 [Canna indica]|uniref:Reverse transcriptase domain-containing protein n=1 Tax=Canna indica TaxID=4628 RepID=A0AAQ3JMG9_9LILI|nr:hypothetical protein Cni_G01382 [Canna indica]